MVNGFDDTLKLKLASHWKPDPKTIKTTSTKHNIALGDVFLYYDEH